MDPVPHWILHAGLAVLMAAAAFHKVSDPAAFMRTLRDYRLLPQWLAPVAALGLVSAELLVGAALLVPKLSTPAALACAALLVVYSLAIAVNLARGRRDIDCGCLGPRGRQPLSGGLLARNGALVVACMLAALPQSGRALGWIDGVSIVGGLVVVLLLFSALASVNASGRRLRRSM
jgi:hypothetical protein